MEVFRPTSHGGENGENWYAVHTRARHERAVAHRLWERGVTTFLPTFTEVHRWNDRKKYHRIALVQLLFVRQADASQRGAAAGASD